MSGRLSADCTIIKYVLLYPFIKIIRQALMHRLPDSESAQAEGCVLRLTSSWGADQACKCRPHSDRKSGLA